MTDSWKRPRRNPHRGGVHRGPRGPVEPIGDVADRYSLEFHIAEFLEWSAVRGFADTTIATRKRELDRLHRWLSERGVTRTSGGDQADDGPLPALVVPLPQGQRPTPHVPHPEEPADAAAHVLLVGHPHEPDPLQPRGGPRAPRGRAPPPRGGAHRRPRSRP